MILEPASLIWATRGRTWGFRFLRNGGMQDPLPAYEEAFQGLDDEREVLLQNGRNVALRVLDPEGRKDAFGRAIQHDFVVPPPLAARLGSTDDGVRLVWEPLSAEYAAVWKAEKPPATQ